MKTLTLIALGALAAAGISCGQPVTGMTSTRPVGFGGVIALGNSDTLIGLPATRQEAHSGRVKSVSRNVITTSTSALTWTANCFVYVAGTQPNTYYLEFDSGPKVGMSYTVTANGPTTVTLNLNGDTLDGAVVGNSFRIIPYWTLGTRFRSGSVTGSSDLSGGEYGTRVLTFSTTLPGINLPPQQMYFYYTGGAQGGAAGWRRIGGDPSAAMDDEVLPPDAPFIVRQQGVPDLFLPLCGDIPTVPRASVIGTLAPNTPQDNHVALQLPIPITLAQSHLVESGAFSGTANISGTDGDQVLIFNPLLRGYNKPASATYFYFTGNGNNGPGWRLLGGDPSKVCDNDLAFQSDSGCVIRKAAAAIPSTVVWTIPLPYVVQH